MTLEHRPIDRSGWGEGPWDGEPDRVEFEHAGLPCLITRIELGTLCGYVAVPPGHPLHGRNHSSRPVRELDVAGGVTYAAACAGHICHVPKPGEPDDVWWLGFDTARAYNVMPGLRARFPGGSYKGLDYVRRELEGLAEQLAAASPGVMVESPRPRGPRVGGGEQGRA